VEFTPLRDATRSIAYIIYGISASKSYVGVSFSAYARASHHFPETTQMLILEARANGTIMRVRN
jgi:hypothetical protein